MKPPKLSQVTEGTRWPSGESVDLALLPLTEDQLADRVGLPLVHGVEAGLGRWGGIGGRLPSGTDVEFVCYAHIPTSVVVRVDKKAHHATAFAEALELVGLSRSDLKHVSPLVDS